MKNLCCSNVKFKWILWIVAATVTTIFVINEKKKKDEEQLEEYLDYSIQ